MDMLRSLFLKLVSLTGEGSADGPARPRLPPRGAAPARPRTRQEAEGGDDDPSRPRTGRSRTRNLTSCRVGMVEENFPSEEIRRKNAEEILDKNEERLQLHRIPLLALVTDTMDGADEFGVSEVTTLAAAIRGQDAITFPQFLELLTNSGPPADGVRMVQFLALAVVRVKRRKERFRNWF